jgi:formamidopyrimidine-DNA glycosylase
MPELPDVTIYVEALRSRIVGKKLLRTRLASPFVLRSVDPPLSESENSTVLAVSRLGKRIVWELENKLYFVFHLMIAGRFHWKAAIAKPPGKMGLAVFDFPHGSLVLTEASTKRRASLFLVRGKDSLARFERSGLEVLDSTFEQFRNALLKENHTLKRALTDPRLFSAIGNAYSDEILHAARISPLALSQKLTHNEIGRLYDATKATLSYWVELLRKKAGGGFPEKVTAFHEEMAVHGKFGKPCPVCGTKVQRIVYAENECNYCPRCQTGGKILADRSLSRLLKQDWPTTIEELEEQQFMERS